MVDINKKIFDFIQRKNICEIEDLINYDVMTNIVLSSTFPNFNDVVKRRFSLSNSFNLCYDFFSSLSKKYGNYFYGLLLDDTFILKHNDNCTENAMFYVDCDGTSQIFLPYCNTFCDCFTLAHEVIHSKNTFLNVSSFTRSYFSEFLSFFCEDLLGDYVCSKYSFECAFNKKNNFQLCYYRTLGVDFQVKLIMLFLNNGYVSDYDIKQLILSYDFQYQSYINDIYKMILNDDISIDYDFRYLVGILLTCYVNENFSYKERKKLFLCLNDSVNQLTVPEFYSILDLPFKLDCDSTKKLSSSYTKCLKKL